MDETYRTGTTHFIRDFFEPCFSRSIAYERGVGYFSSSWLRIAGSAFQAFLARGGSARFVASPALSARDTQTLKNVATTKPPFDPSYIGTLEHILTAEKVQIKLARPRHREDGIYHEKFGIFWDGKDFVAFSGSLNETVKALISNYELIHVFCSWREPDLSRVLELKAQFALLWKNEHPEVEVKDYRDALDWIHPASQAASSELDEHDLPESPSMTPSAVSRFGPPKNIRLRPHQISAVTAWLDAQMRGILRMATGSGKTAAALTAASLIVSRCERVLILVTCPYTHLVDQWCAEATTFGFDPIPCYGSSRVWHGSLSRRVGLLTRGTEKVVMIVATNSTFEVEALQVTLRSHSGPSMLIADEVHSLGAPAHLRTLQDSLDFRYRIGLSATPERWFDDDSTAELFAYFGSVVYEYGLQNALNDGVLVPYNYYPELVSLTDPERDQYSEITRRLARTMGTASAGDNPQANLLLFKRARLLASAQNKLPHLCALVTQQQQAGRLISHTLVYCGDGTVETDSDDPNPNERRYVSEVTNVFNFELGIKTASYLAETRLKERLKLHHQLATGETQAIAAIRCLDEGVDIPSVRSAYILASSRNPRQFIQRRGRVLRRDDASGKTSAEIFDFVVVPPEPENKLVHRCERELLKAELRRVIEFGRNSRNHGVTLQRLRPLRQQFNLMGYEGEDKSG